MKSYDSGARLISITVNLDNWEFSSKDHPHTKLACEIIPLIKGHKLTDLHKAVESIDSLLIESVFIDYQE